MDKSYNDKLSPSDQIDSEELIAFLIHDNTAATEECCQMLSQQILKEILLKFRPDLFEEEQPDDLLSSWRKLNQKGEQTP